jgi:hypothetical protein
MGTLGFLAKFKAFAIEIMPPKRLLFALRPNA